MKPSSLESSSAPLCLARAKEEAPSWRTKVWRAASASTSLCHMAFAERAPLSARQLDALRRLEAWASQPSSISADDATSKPALRYTLDANSSSLAAHAESDAPADSIAPVDSSAALEAFALRAELILRERRHEPDRAQLKRLEAQRECAAEMAAQCESLRARLDGKADECAALRGASSELLTKLTAQVQTQREEAELQEALRQQLAPLEEARAVAATLDRRSWRDDEAHSPNHPLVLALEQLDKSANHLREHAHWTNSATHLAQVNATRVRALSLVASIITKPIEVLTASSSARLNAPAAPLPKGGAAAAAPAAEAATAEAATEEAAATAGRPRRRPRRMLRPRPRRPPPTAAAARRTRARAARRSRPSIYTSNTASSPHCSPHGSARSSPIRTAVRRPPRSYVRCLPPTGVQGVLWRAAIYKRRSVSSPQKRRRMVVRPPQRPFYPTLCVDAADWQSAPAVRSTPSPLPSSDRRARPPPPPPPPPPQPWTIQTTQMLPRLSSVSSDPSMHIAAVCQPLYDELRPTLLSQQELTDLCEVVLIFRTEVLPDIIAGGPPSQPLERSSIGYCRTHRSASLLGYRPS